MLEIKIPGYKTQQLHHLVLDYNGTLACDGQPLAGVKERLNRLAELMQLHILTADTFGTVQTAMADVACEISILPVEAQDVGKRRYVERLGTTATVAIGNGRNDQLMLQAATLGLAVIQEEAAAVQTVLAADVVAPNILAALDLLLQPKRLVATLRS